MDELTADTGLSHRKQFIILANTGLTGSDIELVLTLTYKSCKKKSNLDLKTCKINVCEAYAHLGKELQKAEKAREERNH